MNFIRDRFRHIMQRGDHEIKLKCEDLHNIKAIGKYSRFI